MNYFRAWFWILNFTFLILIGVSISKRISWSYSFRSGDKLWDKKCLYAIYYLFIFKSNFNYIKNYSERLFSTYQNWVLNVYLTSDLTYVKKCNEISSCI